jgi:hypothetical protein
MQILLCEMGRRRRLAEPQQDLFAAEQKRHHRQRHQQRGPHADAKRPSDQMRIARAKGLRRQRRHRRYQPHAEGEADKEDGMRQRRRGHRLAAEAADHRDVGRHHRDLAELRQRERNRQLQRLGEFDGEMTAGYRRGVGRRGGCAFNLVERGHGGRLPSLEAE